MLLDKLQHRINAAGGGFGMGDGQVGQQRRYGGVEQVADGQLCMGEWVRTDQGGNRLGDKMG